MLVYISSSDQWQKPAFESENPQIGDNSSEPLGRASALPAESSAFQATAFRVW